MTWRPYKLIFLELFWGGSKTGLAKLLEDACPNCRKFAVKFFGVVKPEITLAIFPIKPGQPGRYPAGLHLSLALR